MKNLNFITEYIFGFSQVFKSSGFFDYSELCFLVAVSEIL